MLLSLQVKLGRSRCRMNLASACLAANQSARGGACNVCRVSYATACKLQQVSEASPELAEAAAAAAS